MKWLPENDAPLEQLLEQAIAYRPGITAVAFDRPAWFDKESPAWGAVVALSETGTDLGVDIMRAWRRNAGIQRRLIPGCIHDRVIACAECLAISRQDYQEAGHARA